MKISDSFWDLLAPIYAKLRHNPISGYFLKKENRAIEALLENLIPHDIKMVGDLGVGRGHSLFLIPKTIPHKIAIDKSFPMIRLSRKDFPDTIFIHADVLNLPLKNSSFDLLFCIGLTEYISELEPLISQLNTILKNGGHLLLSFSPKNIFTFLRLLRGHRIYARKNEEINNYIMSYQFEIVGLKITALQHQYLLQKKK